MSDGKAMHYHLDLLGGLAGDMFLATLLDAALVDREEVEKALQKVGLGPVKIETERVVRGAIEGTRVWFSGWDPSLDSDHRHLTEIRRMIRESGLSEAVKARTLEMFEVLGAAESSVHGIELERVHFHEVGAIDSILDFVAAAFAIEKLGGTWSFGEIPVGSGTIETAHGTIPVPAPATALLLKGMELSYQDVSMEFVTPTGATILATIASKEGAKRGRLLKNGFGCGFRDPEGISNVVRVLAFERSSQELDQKAEILADLEEVLLLTTEIDDQNPEALAEVGRALLEAGAKDVVFEGVVMKKGRLGTRVSVLLDPVEEARFVTLLFENTSTFGIRRQLLSRWVLARTTSVVETPYGEVEVKLGWWGDEVLKVSPEFKSCADRARTAGVPLHEVYLAAQLAARRKVE